MSSERLDPVSLNSPTERLVLFGLSHHTLPLGRRERLTLSPSQLTEALNTVITHEAISEGSVISTCNRVELLAVIQADCEDTVEHELFSLLSRFSGLTAGELREHGYRLRDRAAAVHLFRVAAGLDSQVLGEPQILGQLKASYELAKTAGGTRAVLHRLYHRAFSTAKLVRTKTNIGRSAVSVCYAARKLAEQIFGALESTSVLVLGTGEMARLALRHFSAAGAKQIFVTSRNWDRACSLAEAFSGVPLSAENVDAFLPKVDIVIGASTVETEGAYCITKARVQAALRERRSEVQFFVDFGVPRNFEPTIAELTDKFLYNLDELAGIVQQNLDRRALELENAESLVHEEADRFMLWWKTHHLAPAIAQVRGRFESFRDEEVRKTVRRLRALGIDLTKLPALEEALSMLGEALVKKTLHQPLTVLKRRGAHEPELSASFLSLFLDRSAFDQTGNQATAENPEPAEAVVESSAVERSVVVRRIASS